MRIREIVEVNYNELPGYDMLGYLEVAVPVYQRKIHALTLTQKTIPVVEEFILNFYNEGLNIDDIKLILGLEQQIIDEALAGLLQRDYISYISREITNSGKRYLEENSVEKLEKIEFNIMIDGLTGEVSKANNNLMVTRTIKNKGIWSIKSNISKPTLQSLDFNGVKRVFNQYKESDKEVFSGNMLDIVHIEGNTTKYKRIDILIFKNKESDIRLIAFDNYKRLDNYEEKLLELDSKGINLFKYNFEDYFESEKVKSVEMIINEGSNGNELLEYSNVNKMLDSYLDEKEGNIIIIAPLVSQCNMTTSFIDEIESKLKEGLNIKFIISGRDFIGEYQKKTYIRLLQLSKKHLNLKVIQIPIYINKMIINCDKSEALVSVYKTNDITLNGSKTGIVENIYAVKNDNFDRIKKIVNDISRNDDINAPDLSKFSISTIKDKVENISKLVKDADGYMYSNDDIGWIGGGEIPEIINLLTVPLATNSESFRTFIDALNKSLVESLDVNSKRKGNKSYFWKEFKIKYKELQYILDKIRTYRNKGNHLVLDENNKKKYQEYLHDDIKGYMPDFIENGYLILQYKILNDLELAIKNTISTIK